MKETMDTIKPEVGMGVTIMLHSDRLPYTIIDIINDKKIIIQEDKSIRIDNNGMSEIQEYKYEPDLAGNVSKISLRKDGTYRVVGGNILVHIGERRKYFDFSW